MSGQVREWAREWSRWSYAALAVALCGLALVQLLAEQPAGPLPFAALISVVAVAAVALLPQWPLVTLVTVSAGVAALFAMLPVPPFATFVATMVACYGLVRHGSRRAIAAGLIVLLIVVAAIATREVTSGDDELFGVVYPIVYFGGAGLVGWLTRHRAAHLRLVEERAALLEREREARDALAAADERARLARDLHDVVAHGVSLMVLQAEAASEVLSSKPGHAAEALSSIAETGRVAVADLHDMLGMLRGHSTAEYVHLDVDDLLERVRQAGLSVAVDVTGTAVPLPLTVGQTARRIVQEALTNTMRHAEARYATVEFQYGDDELVVHVRDDGARRAPAVTGTGQGLRGMAERAAEHGGSVEAGPTPGGFAVCARLPYSKATRSPS
jgi:signal transduction histidine kinase